MQHTIIGNDGDLENYYPWKYLKEAHKPLDQFIDNYKIGYFWVIDENNDIIWHNGEIAQENEEGENVGFQSFLGFSKSRNRVVVVLSNVIAYDEEETAYTDLLGYRLLLEDEKKFSY